MEFSRQYLTYGEYRLLGGELPLMPFNILEFKARKKIDDRTFNRLKNLDEVPQEVKMCVFELMKNLQSYDSYTTQNKGVASENIDGYSVTYSGANAMFTETQNKEIEDVIETYLANTVVNNVPVLYLGVC